MWITPENSIRELRVESPKGFYILVEIDMSMLFYRIVEYKGEFNEFNGEKWPVYDEVETFFDNSLPKKYANCTIICDEFIELPNFT